MSNFHIKPPSANSQGFAYLALLILLIIIGAALAGAGQSYSAVRKRDKEQELLKVGNQFRLAIGQYYQHTPSIIKQYPPTLESLVLDKRFAKPRRYIREIYRDPTTGNNDWGILEAPGGGIMGIYSLSAEDAIKTKNFRLINKSFENKKHYSDWIFFYVP